MSRVLRGLGGRNRALRTLSPFSTQFLGPFSAGFAEDGGLNLRIRACIGRLSICTMPGWARCCSCRASRPLARRPCPSCGCARARGRGRGLREVSAIALPRPSWLGAAGCHASSMSPRSPPKARPSTSATRPRSVVTRLPKIKAQARGRPTGSSLSSGPARAGCQGRDINGLMWRCR
jgi:hypothetical protein